MKCPLCGRADLVRETCDEPYPCNGETPTTTKVTRCSCPACGEVISQRFDSVWDAIAETAEEAKAMKRRSALRRIRKMKDRSHDEAMAELFKEDPAYAVDLVNSILDDGDQDDLQIAFRQMDKAGLFDRAGVLYEVACDVIGAIIAHYSETLAHERGKPVPDAATVERIEATKRALRMERDELDASNAEAIKAVIRKYGPQARALYQVGNGRPV